jgi:hypothetical protein
MRIMVIQLASAWMTLISTAGTGSGVGTLRPRSHIRLSASARERSPEPDILGVSNMRTLKITCVFFALSSAALVIQGAWEIDSSADPVRMKHAVISTIWSLLLLAFWGGAIYGIQKKALIAWKLGWGAIAAELLAVLDAAFSVRSRIPSTDSPGVAAAAAVVGGTAVVLYWAFWWNRQRSYFVKSTAATNGQE